MVGGDTSLGGVVDPGMRPGAELAFVRDQVVEYRHEGLAGLPLAPVGLVAGFVPHFAGRKHGYIFMLGARLVMLRMCSEPELGG